MSNSNSKMKLLKPSGTSTPLHHVFQHEQNDDSNIIEASPSTSPSHSSHSLDSYDHNNNNNNNNHESSEQLIIDRLVVTNTTSTITNSSSSTPTSKEVTTAATASSNEQRGGDDDDDDDDYLNDSQTESDTDDDTDDDEDDNRNYNHRRQHQHIRNTCNNNNNNTKMYICNINSDNQYNYNNSHHTTSSFTNTTATNTNTNYCDEYTYKCASLNLFLDQLQKLINDFIRENQNVTKETLFKEQQQLDKNLLTPVVQKDDYFFVDKIKIKKLKKYASKLINIFSSEVNNLKNGDKSSHDHRLIVDPVYYKPKNVNKSLDETITVKKVDYDKLIGELNQLKGECDFYRKDAKLHERYQNKSEELVLLPRKKYNLVKSKLKDYNAEYQYRVKLEIENKKLSKQLEALMNHQLQQQQQQHNQNNNNNNNKHPSPFDVFT